MQHRCQKVTQQTLLQSYLLVANAAQAASEVTTEPEIGIHSLKLLELLCNVHQCLKITLSLLAVS